MLITKFPNIHILMKPVVHSHCAQPGATGRTCWHECADSAEQLNPAQPHLLTAPEIWLLTDLLKIQRW